MSSSVNELRPQGLADIIGQTEVVKVLQISIDGAKRRNEALGHILVDGSPGLGKTSLAMAVAHDMGVPIQVANGPAIKGIKHLLPYLSKITEGSIFFIDEIHRLNTTVQEFLYTALEDYKIYLVQDKSMPVTIELPRFTLIGATTESGAISRPMYDRFVVHQHLKYYTEDELTKLVTVSSGKLSIDMPESCARIIAAASRGTPRVANNLLRWIRDYVADNDVTDSLVLAGLKALGVERGGLDTQDRVYLDTLKDRFNGGPVGLLTMSAATGLSVETLEQSIEPFLLRSNLIDKSPQGRVLK